MEPAPSDVLVQKPIKGKKKKMTRKERKKKLEMMGVMHVAKARRRRGFKGQ